VNATPPLVDRFGRAHTYVRISVTDRCNFRCVYCMPPEGMDWMPREDVLRFEEIARLARVFARMGVRKVRLTGGEPTLRRDIVGLVHQLGAIPGLRDLSMTTNAYRLGRLASTLARGGMTRVNVSLDSLDAERFAAITRGGRLASVLEGVAAAREAGMTPVKINCVIMAGENDDEILPMVDYFSAWPDDVVLRFIEYMPFNQRLHQTVTAEETRRRIGARYTLTPLGGSVGGDGPARTWRVAETGLAVGFISPLSAKFCASCNRLRLMADGHLRTCLSDDETPSLRDFIRGGASDTTIEAAIRGMVMGKREGHGCAVEGGAAFEGVMTRIGG